MEHILFRHRVLRYPSPEAGIVEPGAEVVDVERCSSVPFLALVLLGLEGRQGSRRQRAAQRVVVVGLQDRPGVVHDGTDRAQVVPDEVAAGCGSGGEVDVAAVEAQAFRGACAAADLLEDEVPDPVDGGRRGGAAALDGPHLAELGAVGGVEVVDRRVARRVDRNGDGLREADLVPGDGGDPPVGVGRQSIVFTDLFPFSYT